MISSSLVDPIPSSLRIFMDETQNSRLVCRLLDNPDLQDPSRLSISAQVALLVGEALTFANKQARVPSQYVPAATYEKLSSQLERSLSTLINSNCAPASVYAYCQPTSLAAVSYLALQMAAPPQDGRPQRQFFLSTAVRIVRELSRSSIAMLSEPGDNCMPVVALCSIARAAEIMATFFSTEIPKEEARELLENLRRYGERWNLGTVCLGKLAEQSSMCS